MTNLNGPFSMPVSGGQPKQIIILLHGLGANGQDLFELVPYFKDILKDAYFISPDAPFACDMAPFGYQWFSLLDRTEEAILKGAREATLILNEFIDELLKKFNLSEEQVALIGFSQGGMLSLHAGLRRDKSLAGILSYSGALVAPKLLKTEMKSRPPICLVHGQMDEVVPYEAFEDALTYLQSNGIDVHGYSREDLGHGIDPAGLKIGVEFMKTIFNIS